MKKMTRVLTLVLALAICFSCMAMSVFADGCECTEKCTEKNESKTCKVCSGGNYAQCAFTDPGDGDGDGDDDGDDDGDEEVVSGSCGTSAPAAKAKPFVADVSGKYRTSMTKIMATVSPVAVGSAIENDQLVIDPVTNTVGNLYDSEGNLIPCTLSSDGHFIIVPTNEGFAYIPTGK